MSEPKYILVVGASAGGLNSVTELCAQLKDEMHLAVFVVIHLSPTSLAEILLQRIQRNTTYKCAEAEDGGDIKSKHIYMVLEDKHLVVKKRKDSIRRWPCREQVAAFYRYIITVCCGSLR